MQTKKQDLTNKIKHFIEEYYGQHGTSPSIRCIAENVGCSKSNVTIYIDYDYKLRNYTTSHVHTMLSAALLDMIDRTECLIFYNTPQSICLKDELDKVDKAEKTLSPWIYSELSATRVLRCQKPDRLKRLRESFEHRDSSKFNDSTLPHIEYDVSASIKNMIKLDDNVLMKWEGKHTTVEHPLDTLYKLVGPK